MMIPIASLIAGLLAGGILMMLGLAWRRRFEIRWAESEAFDMVDGAKKDAQAQDEELNLQFEEMKDEAWVKFENETRHQVQKNDEYSETLDERELKFKEQNQAREANLNRKNQSLNSRQQKLSNVEARVNSLR